MAQSGRDGDGPTLAALVDSNGANIAAMVRERARHCGRGWRPIGQEMAQFASARLRENMDPLGLGHAVRRPPREALPALECDYARNATRQYLDEAQQADGHRVAETSPNDSWAPLEELTKETLGRITRRWT
jgi:hypothetical protein